MHYIVLLLQPDATAGVAGEIFAVSQWAGTLWGLVS